MAVISQALWDRTSPDARTGSPAEGTAKVLRYTTDRGTIVQPVTLTPGPLFELGRILVTPGVLAELGDYFESERQAIIQNWLWDHAHGRWGDLPASDHDANDRSVAAGERIISAFALSWFHRQRRALVVTEADRSATTILLPEEY